MDEKILEQIEEYNTNGKKTIAMFCDVFYPSIDGVISVVNSLSIALSKNYNIVVCVPKHKGKTVSRNEYLVLGAKSFSVPFMDYECALCPSKDKEFMNYLKKLRIDIVHFHSPFFMGKFAVRFAQKNNISLFASFHSQYKKDFWATTRSHLLTKIMLANVMKVFNSADLVFSMNDFCKNVLLSYGLKKPICLIGHGTQMDKEINNSNTELAIKTFELENNKKVLLMVGRLVKVKNHKFLLDVMTKLPQDFVLILVGEGSCLKPLQKRCKKLGIENRVVFTKKIMDKNLLSGLYQRADLFVFPSTYDTEGLVVLEAAAKQTPSIVIADSAAASKIENNVSGFIETEDPDKFAKRIEELFDDKSHLQKVGRTAQQKIYKTWTTVATSYQIEYEKHLKKGE